MSSEKVVLVLGAGLVSPPCIKYLTDHGFKVIVANRTLASAQKITAGVKNTEVRELNMELPDAVSKLDEWVPHVDAVVSLLPYLHHVAAAKVAIKHKKHFFTTSYVSPAMRELNDEAKAAGVIVVNECGVDPGTDHMSAMRIIHAAHAKGGKVVSFSSFCGGLPAPDCNDNPLGYKFSWAPRGVLLASRNPAHYLKDGQDVNIAAGVLFENYAVHHIPELNLDFEAYPNRDSTQYIQEYSIPEVKSMIRGTYRNVGWCTTIKKLSDVNYLDLTERSLEGKTYGDLTAELLGATDGADAKVKFAEKFGLKADDRVLTNVDWLGLFSSEKIPSGLKTNLDALCSLCERKLKYAPGERDMLLMKHEFVIEYADRTETVVCSLIDYGIPNGDSSMSRTVTIPVSIAVRMVLQGKLNLTGLQTPIIPELYNPILDELETFDIKFVDRVEKVVPK
eukprot:TRINITY_DN3763_c0_g2_i2.p1 TRINITY_DN3763_c0_g2~~TRINITY_DN3763_c0_g2_i2.p1  ORF type:complete len:489 (+),score=216.16 TRINITY_DN3763_c0_g2_i2:121-1467(+)